MAEVVVEGTVARLHGRGSGFSVKEEWSTKDGTRHRFWAVFPSEVGPVAEGDVVSVRGSLRTKLSEPRATDGKQFVDLSVSDAVVERGTAPESEAPAEVWPVVEPGGDWDATVAPF